MPIERSRSGWRIATELHNAHNEQAEGEFPTRDLAECRLQHVWAIDARRAFLLVTEVRVLVDALANDGDLDAGDALDLLHERIRELTYVVWRIGMEGPLTLTRDDGDALRIDGDGGEVRTLESLLAVTAARFERAEDAHRNVNARAGRKARTVRRTAVRR